MDDFFVAMPVMCPALRKTPFLDSVLGICQTTHVELVSAQTMCTEVYLHEQHNLNL